MRKSILLAVALPLLTGCMGQVGELSGGEAQYDFKALVAVLPDKPVAGRRVHVSLDLSSHSNVLLTADVVVRVVRPDASVIYEEVWSAVKFHPEEVWSLTQGFLPGTDESGELSIEVLVLHHETGQLLWKDPAALTLTLG